MKPSTDSQWIGQGLAVLIVESDLARRAELVQAVTADPRIGPIYQASHAGDAMTILKSSDWTIEVIFLDIRMSGVDGPGLAKVLSAMEVPPAVVFVADRDDRAVEDFLDSTDYLFRPATELGVSEKIDVILEHRGVRLSKYDDLLSAVDAATHSADARLTFLCHSWHDKERVRELYQRLTMDGIDCWFDEESLLPGQDWELEIAKAIEASRYFIVCLSQTAVSRRGYMQKEIVKALDIADQQPEGVAYIIPVLLEPIGPLPQRLGKWHTVSLTEAGRYERLLKALRK